MPEPVKNIGKSIRARLLNLARSKKQPFELLLTRYVLERLLYRLSQSNFKDKFALKGAMLITVWFPDPHRPTRDLDLLGFGDPSPETIIDVFRDIISVPVDDGIKFDPDSLLITHIRDDNEYGGQRLRMKAELAGARINVVVDIGFGDAIEPGIENIELPVLLDLPKPHLRAYPMETVIAEKFQAMANLGLANSRLKDYYDIWLLSRFFDFDNDRLARAIAATFDRRKTALPHSPLPALSPQFAADPLKRQQWEALIRDVATDPVSLDQVIEDIDDFLVPHIEQAKILQNTD